MKVALAQLNYHIGNFSSNSAKIIAAIEKARNQNVDLVVFAELAICGYPPRDFLEFRDFQNLCNSFIEKIAEKSKGIGVIVGAPVFHKNPKGKNRYNAAYFIDDGKIESIHYKALLPTYDVFDEYRYFEPARNFEVVKFRGETIAVTICEDLWDIEEDRMYPVDVMEELVKHKPGLIVNISASPFSIDKQQRREKVMAFNCLKYNLPLIYVNHVGAQTELIFDGGSFALSKNGDAMLRSAFFTEDFKVIEFENGDIIPSIPLLNIPSKNDQTFNALVLGIKDYFSKIGFKKALVGLSGGIDSALVLTLACYALGKDNVVAIMMPSRYSSDHSITDSLELCRNLGCKNENLPIEDPFNSFSDTLSRVFRGHPEDVTEENIQARIRAVLLMAYSNKFGHVLLNTSNKSESAVGYGTLYGDMAGGLSVIGDLYKTAVYDLANWINQDQEVIPQNIINKAPSAELRPNQRDSDSLPEYDQLDQVLYQYIEMEKGPDEIIEMGFDETLVNRTLKMVNVNEFKRHQSAPVLRITNKAFGMGRRLPIVGKYLC